MWAVNGQDLKMVEGDWGMKLPVNIEGAEFAQNDEILFTLKDAMNGGTVLTKTYTDITDNTIYLEIAESETALLTVGSYCYSLDWYQNSAFMCNIIPASLFKVVDKA